MAARAEKSYLNDLHTEGANGRFRFQFIYNGIQFVVRVLGRNARGVTLFLEGNLGFVPFSYEGDGLRLQLLEVLQFAQKQKAVHINLVAEQRISLTSEILIKGPFNPNTAVAAVATRLARVKPLIDVIRSLQPYHREFSDGLSHYALERRSVAANAENAA